MIWSEMTNHETISRLMKIHFTSLRIFHLTSNISSHFISHFSYSFIFQVSIFNSNILHCSISRLSIFRKFFSNLSAAILSIALSFCIICWTSLIDMIVMSKTDQSLSFNLKTIVSRDRVKNWNENRKMLVKRKSNDRKAISIKIRALRESAVWKDASESDRKLLKKNQKKWVLKDRMKKKLHDNAFW